MSDFKLNVLKVTPKLLQTDSLKKKKCYKLNLINSNFINFKSSIKLLISYHFKV